MQGGKVSIQKYMITSKKPYEMILYATEKIKAIVAYNPDGNTNSNGNNNGNTGSTGNNDGNHASTENVTAQTDGQPTNQTEGFFMKKVGPLRVWMVFVIVGCLLVVFIVCFVLYKKKHNHHHHHHHHKGEDDDDEEEDDEDGEEENAEVEEAPQP